MRGLSRLAWLAVAMGCGTASHGVTTGGGDEAGVGPDDAGVADDGAVIADDGATPPPPTDGGPTGWNGTFTGPLKCTVPGAFKQNNSGSCGTERWAIKTGTDSAAAGLSLLPKLTTIAELIALPSPSTIPATTRYAPTEKTIYALKDVKLAFARLEDDSDYHLVLFDGINTMISEIPFPGTGPACTAGSTWQCLISRARANVDARLALALNQGHSQNVPVSVIGVGFFDPEHGQFGASANMIELHPLLGICFGAGCDPTK